MRSPQIILWAALCWSVAFGATPSRGGEEASKDQLIKDLQCRADQDCPPPPVSRKRGFKPPDGKRGFVFQPSTEDERKKIDDAAKVGKLPSTDVEIFFDYDKAELTPQAKMTLTPLGEALSDRQLAGNRFVLVGHTDAKGSDAYNQPLSEKRAAAVKDYLVATFGIASERLTSYGRGKSQIKNAADPFAAQNRRVQVINHGVTADLNQHK
jgi:outer membrane protein OmpA-like peptidoglycan-associated protein